MNDTNTNYSNYQVHSIMFIQEENKFEADYELDSFESSSIDKFCANKFMKIWNRMFKVCTPQYIEANQSDLEAEICVVVSHLVRMKKRKQEKALAESLFRQAYLNLN